MPRVCDIQVHLLPELAPPDCWGRSVTVVIDVLRATTTIIHALAAGCSCVIPCAEIEDAKKVAEEMRVGRTLLAGERDGSPLSGFDLGNSPEEFTSELCKRNTLILTTTNGTRALSLASSADRVLVAAFVNFSAVCEQLRREERPIHILCAGASGSIALEDTVLAGAFIDFLCQSGEVCLNDSAQLAWDSFENHGSMLAETLELCEAGAMLTRLGFEADIRAAARIDRFALVPELRRDPTRIEIAAVGIANRHWSK